MPRLLIRRHLSLPRLVGLLPRLPRHAPRLAFSRYRVVTVTDMIARQATADDVPAIVALLADDPLASSGNEWALALMLIMLPPRDDCG